MSQREVPDTAAQLGLAPHPEGGWYRRIWTAASAAADGSDRRAASAVHYLLCEGDRSAWHRVLDAEELWCHVRGAPLELRRSPDGLSEDTIRIGGPGDPATAGVPPGWWQCAQPLGGETLVICTVVPEFRFESFEMAPPCWEPGAGPPA